MNEEFEKWAVDHGLDTVTWSNGNYQSGPTVYAAMGYNARQPEIDALRELNFSLMETNGISRLQEENAALKAELDRLRKASEIAIAEMGKCVDGKDCELDTAIETIFIAMGKK